jgi:LPXTG-motif cell wall-anchored protein
VNKAAILLIAVILGLTVSYSSRAQFARAQPFAPIQITSSGGVDPATAPIEPVGDVYKITANIFNTPLIVEKNDILLDGKGFILQGPGMEVHGLAGVNLTCINVTVANFVISDWQVGVLGVYDNNTIVANNFTNNALDVAVYANDYRVIGNDIGAERIVGNNNIISQNQITLRDLTTGFWITSSSGTVIEANNVTLSKLTTFFISADNSNFQVYHNNFLNVEENIGGYLLLIFSYPQNHTNATSPPWDSGYPSGGNYWSDYARRYPAAVKVGSSGIGSIQYVSSTTPEVIDRYPLLAPYSFSKPAVLAQPSPSPSTNSTLAQEPPQTGQSNDTLVAVIIAVLFGATLILIVYSRKRKNLNRKK